MVTWGSVAVCAHEDDASSAQTAAATGRQMYVRIAMTFDVQRNGRGLA
jgi:hypothetical protein